MRTGRGVLQASRPGGGGVLAVAHAIERVRRGAIARGHERAKDEGRDRQHQRAEASVPALYLLPALRQLAIQRPQRSCSTVAGRRGSTDMTQGDLLRTIREVLTWERDKRAQTSRPARTTAGAPAADAEQASPPLPSPSSIREERAALATRASPAKHLTGRGTAREDNDAEMEATRAHLSRLADAVAAYSPTIDPIVVRRVAARCDPRGAVAQAAELRAVLQQVGVEAFLHSSLPRWQRALADAWHAKGNVAARESEEAVGIVGRLCLASSAAQGGRRQQRLGGFVQDAGDLQVNEVLPNGRVVAFTEPTALPDGSPIPPELAASLKDALLAGCTDQTAAGSRESAVFLHFVLYREGVSLTRAFRTLAAFCKAERGVVERLKRDQADDGDNNSNGVLTITEADFAVNAPLEDAMVAVQTCSLRVALPARSLDSREQRILCRHISRRIARVNKRCGHGGRARLLVQLLGWRVFPCSATVGAACRAQYALMLRGVTQQAGHQESLALGAAVCVPNYFGPRHFGPMGCPFRWHHVAAALEGGRFAEAALMAALLSCNGWLGERSAPLPTASAWIGAALQRLAGEEERAAAWRQHFAAMVPPALQARALDAKAALLWNVVLSSRVSLLSGSGRQGILAATPDPGDFVFAPFRDHAANVSADAKRMAEEERDLAYSDGVPLPRRQLSQHTHLSPFAPCLVKPELLPHHALLRAHQDVSKASVDSAAAMARAVEPTASADEVAPFSLLHVVAPLEAAAAGGGSAALLHLSRELGFPTPSPMASPSITGPLQKLWLSERSAAALWFRALFTVASGFPRAARPWVKEFTEPVGGVESAFKLATDLDLASPAAAESVSSVGSSHRSPRRDFAERSRGQQADVWPIGKYGRGVTDRLPPGLVASEALSHGGPSPSAGGRHASKCLVLHFTLPAETYASNFLREFCLVENRCRLEGVAAALPTPPDDADAASPLPPQPQPARPSPIPRGHAAEPGGRGREWSEGNMLSLSLPRSRRGSEGGPA